MAPRPGPQANPIKSLTLISLVDSTSKVKNWIRKPSSESNSVWFSYYLSSLGHKKKRKTTRKYIVICLFLFKCLYTFKFLIGYDFKIYVEYFLCVNRCHFLVRCSMAPSWTWRFCPPWSEPQPSTPVELSNPSFPSTRTCILSKCSGQNTGRADQR